MIALSTQEGTLPDRPATWPHSPAGCAAPLAAGRGAGGAWSAHTTAHTALARPSGAGGNMRGGAWRWQRWLRLARRARFRP